MPLRTPASLTPAETRSLCRSLFLLACSGCSLCHWSAPLNLRPCRLVSTGRVHNRTTFFVAVGEHQFKMRNAPLITESPTLRRRTNALHAWPIVSNRALYVQVVDVNIQILLGAQKVRVIQRRLQQLAHVRGDSLFGVKQRVARLLHPAPFDKVQHQARLLGRDSQVTHFGSKFHSRLLCLWRRRRCCRSNRSRSARNASRFRRDF